MPPDQFSKALIRWSVIGFFILLVLCVILDNRAGADIFLPDRHAKAVVDDAHLLSPAVYATLNKQLVQWHRRSHHDVVVDTVADLHDYPIEDYGYKLGRAWRLGRTGVDDAAILIYAKVKDHGKLRLEVARGLSVVLTDALSKHLVHQISLQIKAKGVGPGLIYGATLITAYIDAHEGDVKKAPKESSSSVISGSVIALLVSLVTAVVGWWIWLRKKKPKTDPSTAVPIAEEAMNSTSYRPFPSYGQRYESYHNNPYIDAATGAGIASSLNDSYRKRQDSDNSSNYSSSSSTNDTTDYSFSSNNDDSTSFDGGGASEDC